MAKKDQLVPLIKSLTPSERKYFVQFSLLRSDEKSYMKLYRCILRDQEFNIENLAKELGKSKANIAHEKEYLIYNILKALRNFHDTSPGIELNNRLSDVFILKNKQLYDLARIHIRKALKQSEQNARFETAWKLLSYEGNIPHQLPPHKEQKNWEERTLKMLQTIEQMQLFTDFSRLEKDVVQIYSSPRYRTPEGVALMQNYLNHPLLQKKISHPYFCFKQQSLLGHLHFMLRHPKEHVIHSWKALQLVEKYPLALQANEVLYMQSIHSYLTALSMQPPYKEYLRFLKKLENHYYRKLPFDQELLDKHFAAFHFFFLFDYYLSNAGKSAELRAPVKKLLLDLEKKRDPVKSNCDDLGWLQIQRNAAYLYFFFLHDDHNALKWVDGILNREKPAIIDAIVARIKVISILIHFQLGNYKILPHLIRSATRHLKKYGLYTIVEEETFRFILQFQTNAGKEQKKQAFKELAEKYELIKQTPSNQRIFRSILYDLWLARNL